jgi:hypothetical protein
LSELRPDDRDLQVHRRGCEKVAALDEALVELARRFDCGDGSLVLDWGYLLFTVRRA